MLGKVASVHYTTAQKVKQGDRLYTLQLDGIDHRQKWVVNELQKAKKEHIELIEMKNTIRAIHCETKTVNIKIGTGSREL